MTNNEFELISCEKIKHIKIFLNNITYRNYHIHGSFEFLLVLEGQGRVNLSGMCLNAGPGSLICLNPFEPHEIEAADGNMVVIVFQVSRQFCEEYYPPLKNTRFLQRHISAYLVQEPALCDDLRKLICEASLSYLQGEVYFEFLCLEHTAKLFRLLLQWLPHEILSDHDRNTLRKKVQRMSRMLSFLEENYQMQVRLQDLARQEGLTPTYVSHFFSESFGITFQEYLNNIRFEKAIGLLRGTSLSVRDIALSSGFSDPKYLNKIFLQKMGCTLQKYRSAMPRQQKQDSRNMVHGPLEYPYPPERAIEILMCWSPNRS